MASPSTPTHPNTETTTSRPASRRAEGAHGAPGDDATGALADADGDDEFVAIHQGHRTFNAQVTANSSPKAKAPRGPRKQTAKRAPGFCFLNHPDDRPILAQLNLPGDRRAREGRGGAHGALQVARTIIRCPLTAAMAGLIPARKGGRPACYTDTFWIFYMQWARELGSLEAADAALKDPSIWREIAKEFWFEHNQALSTRPATASAFFKWRDAHLRGRVEELMTGFTSGAAMLAGAIKDAESDADYQANILNPHIWDVVAADGTVMRSASDVRTVIAEDESGESIAFIHGSRATPQGTARVGTGNINADSKRSGARSGLMHVTATCKGRDTYTRVVLSFDIGDDSDTSTTKAELEVAKRCLHRLYSLTDATQFPVLVYDGLLMPSFNQGLLRDHGRVTVNRAHARKRNKATRSTEAAPSPEQTGWSQERYGTRRGRGEQPNLKRTYVTELGTVLCSNGGNEHTHDLIVDNGSVYEVASLQDVQGAAQGVGVQGKTRLEPTDAQVLQSRKTRQHALRMTFTGHCADGGGTYRYAITLEPNARDTTIRLGDLLGNLRLIAEDDDLYGAVAGSRNQIESFFSWLEQRHQHKDRASAYTREDQLLDLLAACMLHNSEAWAHLAHRHPDQAVRFLEKVLESTSSRLTESGMDAGVA